MTPLRPLHAAAAVLVAGLLAACGTSAAQEPGPASSVTIDNCGSEVAFPGPAQRMYVAGDGNLLATVLALGAQDQVAGVSGLTGAQRTALVTAYGADVVDGVPVATKDYPTLENVIAQRPDVMLAGWNYGYSEEKKLTPDALAERDIAGYVLSESCRQADGRRGTMPPWQALAADIDNVGAITGRADEAVRLNADIDERRAALESAPQASTPPTVFLFDSGTKQIFTSGSFGGPQAIIEAAGGRNATEDVKDTWTEVSWEQLVAARPDYFAFVDYDGQTFEQKVAVLKANPATKDLPAVKEGRFLNLPIPAWTSSPLNIDAAEQLRASLEEAGLVPESDIAPRLDLQP